jgi:hypothetical protein
MERIPLKYNFFLRGNCAGTESSKQVASAWKLDGNYMLLGYGE